MSLISEYKGQSHKRDGNGRNEGERRVLMPSDSLHTGHHALACHIQDGVFLCSCNAAASAVSPHSPLLLPSFRREMLSRMPYGQINSVTYHKSMCAFFSLHLQFPSLTLKSAIASRRRYGSGIVIHRRTVEVRGVSLLVPMSHFQLVIQGTNITARYRVRSHMLHRIPLSTCPLGAPVD